MLAPNAPTPLASVGVAIPAKIEPNTAIINTSVGSIALKTYFNTVKVSGRRFSEAGATSGLKNDNPKI